MIQNKVNYKYEVLLLLINKSMHGRELAKKLDTSLTRVQSILTELRGINVLDYKVAGKNHVYFIKKNLQSKSLILNAENYKLIKILDKYPKFEPLFQDVIIKSKCSLIILFGSYAKGVEKKESDIDIYVDSISHKIKKEVEDIYNLINVKIGEFDLDNLLVKEIIKNHVIIKGGELFYEKIKFFR